VNALPSARAGAGRLPDFFIVGHPKSGTSAMYEMLRANPRVHMPLKESWFFVPELLADFSARYPGGIEEYAALFAQASADQLVGEATASYLWSRTAAQRIAEVQPAAKIVAILREPASFLRSLHLQFIRSNVETETDLRKALSLEGARAEGKRIPANAPVPAQLMYSERVHYVEQLRRYRDAFSDEQMLVLIYDDFRAENLATIGQVLRFLGIEDASPVRAVEANVASTIRSPRLHSMVRSLYLGNAPGARALKAPIKAVSSRRMRQWALARTERMQQEAPPPPDEELMRELRLRFKGEVEALSDYLKRDLLALWRYDELG
jgi:hypothetical protein